MSQKSRPQFSKILVPTDGSANAARAAAAAVTLAKANSADLLVLNVVGGKFGIPTKGVTGKGLDAYFDSLENAGKKLVDKVVSDAAAGGLEATGKVIMSEPEVSIVENIVNTAEDEKTDLIVIGTRGLGGFKKLVMGSVASGVVAHAHCAVLVIR